MRIKKAELLKNKRLKRQLWMAVVFILILIGGWYYPLLGFFIPLCMILGLIIALFQGRKWCDWFCPRGSFYDALLHPVSPKRKVPAIFKSMPFRLLIVVFLMVIMAINLILRWPQLNKIGSVFVMLVTTTTSLGIILAFIFHPRAWCSFCPVGTIINLVSKKKHPLKIDSKLCIECELCHKTCPIRIAPYKFKKDGKEIVKDSDCLKCNLCIVSCPKKALTR